MVAYQYRMPAGIPGENSRPAQSTVEPANVTPNGTTGAPTAYGVPMVIDATTGNARTIAAGGSDAAVNVLAGGLLVRPFPTGATQDALGTSTPPTSGVIDLMKRGYMTVLLSGSTASVKGGQVYIWSAAASGAHIVGGFEASNPGGSGFALTGAFFEGAADANGNVEISYNL